MFSRIKTTVKLLISNIILIINLTWIIRVYNYINIFYVKSLRIIKVPYTDYN